MLSAQVNPIPIYDVHGNRAGTVTAQVSVNNGSCPGESWSAYSYTQLIYVPVSGTSQPLSGALGDLATSGTSCGGSPGPQAGLQPTPQTISGSGFTITFSDTTGSSLSGIYAATGPVSTNSGINPAGTWMAHDLTVQVQNTTLTLPNPVYDPRTKKTSNVVQISSPARTNHIEAAMMRMAAS